MNTLSGRIEEILVHENLSILRINVNDLNLSAIVIDTPESAPHLRKDKPVQVIFKETEVVISCLPVPKISVQNKIPGTISTIRKEQLLTKVTLRSSIGEINSIITTQAALELDLKIGTEVMALIKTNEIMIAKG